MRNALNKKEHYGELFLLYGNLFSAAVKRRLTLFYLDDYSLSEIAESEKVSRNAVFLSVSKGEKKLDEYEKKLGLAKKNREMLALLTKMEESKDAKEREASLSQLKGVIEHGI